MPDPVRFDPYAPTPGWTPPPPDDAPRFDVPVPTDPCVYNPYVTCDQARVLRQLEPPSTLTTVRHEDEWGFAAAQTAPVPVPEPSVLALLVGAGLLWRLRR